MRYQTPQEEDAHRRKLNVITNQVYDLVAGLNIADLRDIMTSVQIRANYRAIIPVYEPDKPQTLFEYERKDEAD